MYENITSFYSLTFDSSAIDSTVTDLGDGTLKVYYRTILTGDYKFILTCNGTSNSTTHYDFTILPGNLEIHAHVRSILRIYLDAPVSAHPSPVATESYVGVNNFMTIFALDQFFNHIPQTIVSY